ncbi:MAG: bifunctional 3'-5' exonuclease/DNA polymerase [Firmicutes bacterium]|nr:bifunctional 3'-5' exonuclease/DNA polymerase [Bacillota bacterium]
MYRLLTKPHDLREYLEAAGTVAFDFETAPDEQYRDEDKAALDPHKSHIAGISFSKAEGDAVYLPLTHRVGENASNLTELWNYLADFFASPNVIKVAHNLAFESMFLYARGIVIQPPVYDTIAAAQMTLKGNTGFRSLADSGLKTLVPALLNTELPTFGEVTNGRHFDELDPADSETIRYACADSDYTLRLYHVFNNWFDRWLPKHRDIVEQIESPTAVYCGIMKYNGILADAARMREQGERCESERRRLKDEIAFMIGDVNIGENASTSAFKEYLFKDLGLPVLKTTAKYQEAADDETMVLLAEWCETNRSELVPLFKLIQEYRRLGKIKSTYIDGYGKHINPVTGRIHADLMPLATETGRFACRKPNLQNLVRSGHDDTGVRNFFIAPAGKVLLSLDFSQIELRVGAFYCRDEKMLETYHTGGDIHDQTATVIYGPGKHDKEQRTIAKNCNFGTFFGLFPRGLQRTLKFKGGLDVTLEQCKEIIANLKAGYPKLAMWQEETKYAATRYRYAETWLGRRRYLPGIVSQDWNKKSFAQRRALNTPIQGTAADILKLALGRILAGLPERPWLRPLLQVHDELVFELPTNKVTEAVVFIKACMEARPFPEFDIPIIAEAAVGVRFGEMKEIEAT